MNELTSELISDYWQLVENLTVKQAALLILGIDPSSETGVYCEEWKIEERPKGYEAVKAALKDALHSQKITGHFEPLYDNDINGNPTWEIKGSINIDESTIERESLATWLTSRRIKSGYNFALANPEASAAEIDLAQRLQAKEQECKALRQELQTQHHQAQTEIQRLETEMQSQQDVKGNGKALASLQKLVIGMAMGGYAYDPQATRSEAPREIVNDLAERGISIDPDTVRAHLKQAAQEHLSGK